MKMRNNRKSKNGLKTKQKGGDGNHNIQSVGMPIQYYGGKLDRYFAEGSPQLETGDSAYGKINARSFGNFGNGKSDCGFTSPNLAPFPKSSGIQTGGDGNHNIQSVGMPIQYYGGKLDRYFAEGSPQLETGNSAYGKINARSFGNFGDGKSDCGFTSPNLAPFPKSSGIQTGGKKQKKSK